MPVLRSREVPALSSKPASRSRKVRVTVDPPATPSQTREAATSQSTSPPPPTSKAPDVTALCFVPGSTRRRSVRVASKSASDGVREEKQEVLIEEQSGAMSHERNMKRKSCADVGFPGFGHEESLGCLSLRSGKRIADRRLANGVGIGIHENPESDRRGKQILRTPREIGEESQGNGDDLGRSSGRARRRFSREEKGKEKLAGDSSTRSENADDFKDLVEVPALDANESVNASSQDERRGGRTGKGTNSSRFQVFRDVARQNASRFAHFNAEEEEGNGLVVEDETEVSPHERVEKAIDDWPGPFSTAMKIIRDRVEKMNTRQGVSSLDKAKRAFIVWNPKKDQGRDCSKKIPLSLQELCTRILVNNADAIASLEHVPDALRHKLCRMLCDSRKINCHFLGLLFDGSPTEIRLRDCSWLTEDQFSKCFDGSDMSCLTVLQLDQCGRCLPDYILLSTLAQSSNSLPVLTTLSLSGACRLTDVGLRALVSAAPRLRSINLSQCSLLTSAGIDAVAAALGSVLQELYINDCQSVEPMLLLPALKKLECVEVLSLAGMETVCDDFIQEFVSVRGHHMKELNLAGCGMLTDSSVEVIAATCPKLCSLDLSNLSELTDYALVHLANGCRELQVLKLCRNAFSDEAVAAFLETSGELLKELLLNNIRKVGQNTALSIARRSRSLHTLDLSFCRNVANEALGLIVDSCLLLRLLKLFGCSQITKVFLDGHSNPNVQIVGLKMSPVLEHIKMPDPQEGPLRYSSAPEI